jgi:hypothetical protein
VNSRPQPYALRAWARRRRSPAATSTPGSPPASRQEVVAKWLAAKSASATMSAPEPAASTHRPLRERPSRQSAPTSRRYLPSRTIGASGTAIAARGPAGGGRPVAAESGLHSWPSPFKVTRPSAKWLDCTPGCAGAHVVSRLAKALA